MAKKKIAKPVVDTGQQLPVGSDLSRWEMQFREATGKLPASMGLNTRIAARDWLTQHPEAKQEWAQKKEQEFSALVVMFEAHGHKRREKIPRKLRERLAQDLPEFVWAMWDTLTEVDRHAQGVKWIEKYDPALEPKRQREWDESLVDWPYWHTVPKLTAQEFCILRHVHDPRKFVRDQNSVPDGEGKTLGERVADDVRIIDRSLGADAKKPGGEWVSWAQTQNWVIPSFLQMLAVIRADGGASSEIDSPEPQENSCSPVKAWQISSHFPVIANADENEMWWKNVMRDAKRYGLKDCRCGDGKKGVGGSLWRPELVAGWLVR
jgi:hypothetical protein